MEMTHSFFMFHHVYCYCKFGVLYNLSRALKLITEIFDGFTDRSKAQNLCRENKLVVHGNWFAKSVQNFLMKEIFL